MARSTKAAPGQSQLRIIGGQWRGRKLSFTPAQGLRPTTDRVRETLFNWLQPTINDARCLDLFAGSGALGLEALSRGASHCDFVDNSGQALTQISTHLETLGSSKGYCHRSTALDFIKGATGTYDIVFVDPPFGLDLVGETCAALVHHALLADDARVYLETARSEPAPEIAGWSLHRDKNAGDVAYRLYKPG